MSDFATGLGYFVIIVIGLLLAWHLISEVVELFRRWFVKPEYPCEKCNSRFTLLSGKNFGFETGKFYRTHCLACGKVSSFHFSYYRGMGRSCGKGVGWEGKSLASVIAENRSYRTVR